jgi:short-subunit dehydrogenase
LGAYQEESVVPKFDLNDRAVLLTGASSGIGRSTAVALARRGARLAIVARTESALHTLAEEIVATGGARPTVVPADLSVRGAAADVAARALDALGELDVLLNNAGGGVGGSQWAVADGDPAREAFEVNLWSPLALIGQIVPRMRDRGTGVVVNVTSAAQTATWPCFGTYAATKAALALTTETLRLELDGSGVCVIEVVPGPVATAVQGETRLIPGIDRLLKPLGLGTPTRAAELIVNAIEHARRRVVYPRPAAVGLALPGVARRRARRLTHQHFTALPLEEREAILSLNIRSGSAGDDNALAAREAWQETNLASADAATDG